MQHLVIENDPLKLEGVIWFIPMSLQEVNVILFDSFSLIRLVLPVI